ncbi:AbiTii domain-containing protein [Pelosinus propionicus]|uniref:AbiTii domain-containing protein n=1 Tax=Pelosinus propionicus DSM 13327 TaxID=1123291 RepID=A0A1I4N8R5_9FIRM|nr:hypothetical protein [Pelosinus propionicus]SFM11687.1 hypothetical protein SAMN04490355_104225 [Pelosinus propionicus DSM 13327]
MASVVLELQAELIKSDSRLSDLLRKGLLISKKLHLKDFETWILNELEGYNVSTPLPEYRILYGKLYTFNALVGKRIMSISDKSFEELLSKRPMHYPMPELEKMIEDSTNQNTLEFVFSGEFQSKLQNLWGREYRFSLHLEQYQLEGIVGAVKTALLKWVLQLESDGILGDGIVFSDKEKESAALRHHTVNNFYAPVQNSQIQQHTQGSTQSLTVEQVDFGKIKETVQDILTKLDTIDVVDNQREDLGVELQTMISQLKSSNPKIGVLKECWASARNILEGTTGSLIASGLAAKIQFLSELLK